MTRNQMLAALFAATCAWSAGVIFASPGCSAGQLTVEEAEAGLSASCVLLARAMTTENPEALDAALSRVCEPGRTRAFLARVIADSLAKKNSLPVPDWLEEPFDSTGSSAPPTDGGAK